MDAARRTGAALEAAYRFVLWLVPTVERFPRRQSPCWGDRYCGSCKSAVYIEMVIHRGFG